MSKKQENQTILPPTADETEIPKDIHEADTAPIDAPPLDPKEEARRRSRADLERKRLTQRKGNKR